MTDINLSSNDKEIFLNTANKQGFFLEERVSKILKQSSERLYCIEKNFLPEIYNKMSGERVEIDLVCASKLNDIFAKKPDKNLIIECKKTDFSWVFSKSLIHPDFVNLIFEYPDGMKVQKNNNERKIVDNARFKFCFSSDM